MEDRALPQDGSASYVEEQTRSFGGSQLRSCFESICHRVRHRHDEDQEGEGESGGGHPFSSEEKESAGREEAHKRKSHQCQVIVIAERAAWSMQLQRCS